MRQPPSDQIRELMGAADLSSTADLKAAKKAAKANYAAELQAQMRANEEAKLRERMERLGIARPPPLQAPLQAGLPDGGGPFSPGAMGAGMMGLGHVSPPRASPPIYQSAGPSIGPPNAFSLPGPGPALGLAPSGSPGGGAAPSSVWSQPPPYQPNPTPFQPAMPNQYQPAGPLGNLYGMSPPNPAPPPPFGNANGYGLQPSNFSGPPPPNFGPNGISGYGPPPGGGYAPPAPPPPPQLLPGPAPPPGPGRDTMHRIEQQAKKDQYRLELEAQIREREERKAAEKSRQREEDMRKEAEMAMAAREAMGRGGGGAPLRDAAGNVVANLRGMGGGMGAGMGPPQGFPGPGGMGMGPSGGMGMGPMMPPQLLGPTNGMGMGMGMAEPPPLMMNGAQGGAMLNGPPPQPMMGGPPMMGSPHGMGPPPGMMGALGGGPGQMDGGQPGVLPNFRFRSDNAYLTPKELDNKQRQMRELQEALEQQIQEKRRAKELEKHREMAEVEREEARFKAGTEQRRGGAQDAGAGDGAGRSKEEVLANAWEKARLEAEELRRNKFAAKRGAGPVSRGPGAGGASLGAGDRGGGPWGDGPGDEPEPQPQLQSQPSAPPVQGGGSFEDMYPPPQLVTGAPRMAVGRPSTPLVVEKVRQVAAAELAAVKQELAAEAAQLREVVAAQGQQVAALKSHAERMEVEAGRAREQVAAMRLGLVQQRVIAAPAAGGGPAYDFDNQLAVVSPPPALADIDLDLPPTGAMLRRSAAPPPVYDMGPAIPAVNNSLLMVENAAASSINSSVAFAANGGVAVANGRPPSRLRAVNPLEASMAGESVFIYPNGREMVKQPHGGPSSQALSPSGPLPFQSIDMASRLGASAAAIPTVVTTQELETGPLPLTPHGGGPASSVANGQELASIGGPPTGPNDAPASAPMATGSSVSVVGSTALERQPASPDRRPVAAPATPLDVDSVMNRNKEKLEMLKGITDLTTGAASVEALDAFLARYAAQRPGLPERTATPVLRVCTPSIESASASAPRAVEHSLLRNGSMPAATPLYSSRTNSVGPLPMGGGRVLQAGERSASGSSTLAAGEGGNGLGSGGGGDSAHGAGVNGSLGGRADSIGGRSIDGGSDVATSVGKVSGCGANLGSTLSNVGGTDSGRLVASPPSRLGTGHISRRNSFTGDRTLQEGALSQLLEPAPRPKTGPESRGAGSVRAPSPMAGRPPMLPNTRYSNSGGSRGGTAGPLSGYVPSCASRPTSGTNPAALPPSRPTSRTVTRGSDDGSFNAASAWPSYNPSRQSSTGGPRVSRSRSLSTNGESRPGAESASGPALQRDSATGSVRPEVLPPPPEDTLDVEMRKGLGAAAAGPPTPPSVGHQGSLPGTPAKGSSRQMSGELGTPAFQIPRSPMLAGARRTGSAASQRGS
ncbi:hypothetical protein VaNZ11_000363 [Volvox africanus]|uniref:Uncharacterized protein n=1 Tax=Volvox africanus TaxID=51714 RepID=A0ABQ5RMW0_9CHLO|nr:hypothetical protein VaNZ11_000363 [Volvox africanus]